MKAFFLPFLVLLFLGTSSVFAQDFAQSKEIKFARGKSAATVTGTLNGDEDVTYTLGAREGQRMQINFTSTSPKLGYSVSSDSGDLVSEKRNTQIVTLTDTGTQTINVHFLNIAGTSNLRNVRYTLKVTIL
jgi:hypothetical protein